MGKVVKETHITGLKGVAAFSLYCAKHNPPILWRPETSNDFGIDGEVELTAKNKEGKTEATGEILKVQIKSTEKGSYIKNDTAEAFDFYATKEDVQYWNKHKLSVLLIIYDDRNETLYVKKISKFDIGFFKKNMPIAFSKIENVLIQGRNDFREKFSSEFKSRVNFSIKEKINTNIFKFSSLPTYIYEFDTDVKTPSDIFSKLPSGEIPIFKLHSKKIYTFYDPNLFTLFCKDFLKYDSKKKNSFKKILNDPATKNLAIELLNQQFKQLCYGKKIGFSKHYSRFYFKLDSKTLKKRREYYDSKSGKRKDTDRTVVSYHEYGAWKFFKHLAFELQYILNDEGLFVAINPQYFFTSDAENVLDDKALITKLTNYLTSREWNEQVLNHVHFLYSYFAKKNRNIVILSMENAVIELSPYITIEVPFGISIDNKKVDKAESHYKKSDQTSMFNED